LRSCWPCFNRALETDSFPISTDPERVRRACEMTGKSGKQTVRCIIATFHLNISGGREPGLQRGVAPMGRPPADRRLIAAFLARHTIHCCRLQLGARVFIPVVGAQGQGAHSTASRTPAKSKRSRAPTLKTYLTCENPPSPLKFTSTH
jgi:hypothetical protein